MSDLKKGIPVLQGGEEVNSLAEAEARAEALRQQLNQASHAYYVLAAPILPDQEYDRLYRELRELEEHHPQVVRPDSPTQRVGEPVEAGLPSVTHRIPLLSLDNVFAVEELPKWEQRLRRHLDGPPDQPLAYACELKVDGVALALRYDHGLLVQGATRGDGHRGEEITASVRTIRSVPLRLCCTDPPAWAEIRGEAFLAEATFSAINQQRRQRSEVPFANARNACAGTLRQLDPQVVASRKVDFVAYGLHLSPEQPRPRQQLAALDWLSAAGFKIDAHARRCTSLGDVGRFYRHWNLQRHDLPYGTDGVVVKLNDLALQEQAGHTQRAPRWAVAMKFSQMEARTTLRKLVTQVGRTGVITPVAEFDPVELEGSIVARATLHNGDFIAAKTDTGLLYAGDTLVVRKAGGIIPEVVRVEPSMSPLTFSSHCPQCGSLLVRESKEALQQWSDNLATQILLDRSPKLKVRLNHIFTELEREVPTRCVNSSCPAILCSALRHWASRDALDIDGLGSERIDQLMERGLVHTIDDLYCLQEADLTALEGWAVISARGLLQSLESSRRQPWHRVLYGLGIPHVGSANAKVLAQAFPSCEQLVAAFAQYQGADELLLADLQGISPAVALSLQTWLSDPANKKLLAEHEACKANWWPLVLYGLRIPHVGPEKARALAQAFPSGEQLVAAFVQYQAADEPLLTGLQSIAPKIQTWLRDPDNKKHLADHEACKANWWPLVLSALIPDVGPKKANALAQGFPSGEQLVAAFMQHEGVDEPLPAGLQSIASKIQAWLKDPENKKLLFDHEACVAAFVQYQGTDEPLPAGFQGVGRPTTALFLAGLQGVSPAIALSLQTWLRDPDNKKRLADHEACKDHWWPLVLSALIPHMGRDKARVLAQAFPSTEQLAEAFAVNRQFQGAGKQHLADLEGIGHEIAFSLQTWLGNPANQRLLERLAKAGLQLRSQTDLSTESAPGPLTGQTFVLTGTLPSLRRVEAQKRIEAAGGSVSNSVSKKTTHLVVGANPSSKLDKARTLGIEILDEEALLQRLGCQRQDLTPPNQDLGDLPLLKNMSQDNTC